MPRGSTRRRSLFRRAERVLVGAAMAIVALVLERLVMRALKKKGGGAEPQRVEPTQITTRGGAIDFEPES